MKNLTLTLALIISFLLNYTLVNANNNDKSSSIDCIEQTYSDVLQTNNTIDLRDCTVRLDFTLDDGTTVQGEITFSDVSWWDCTKMQLAAWWERTF